MKSFLWPTLLFAIVFSIFAIALTFTSLSTDWIITMIRWLLLCTTSFALGLVFGYIQRK